ncbi:hypothetical protein CYFUS_008977 [Cystobacter fuscus]|uniref:DUF4350 domain-containing protein n=1 Tax=Cystobacter fuscus TaxID=43 RepID=A0A250JJ44_9BACT|nr:hypothetical protein [Cystobacter fuscus]ATB43497.1 hypothetical protein CYFUS_008977 [Cystobacter fuscus]
MREWRALLLVLGLCAGVVRAEVVIEEAAPAAAVEDPRLPGYVETSGAPESASDGELRVSVATTLLRSPRGYYPLEVELHNTGSTPRVVEIGITATASEVRRVEVSRRQVEVGPRQRLSAWMIVPVIARGGIVRVESPGLTFRAFSFYSTDGSGQPVLVLGTQKAFEEGTHLPRVEEGKLAVRFLSPENAPRELAAYVGHPFIVVAGDVTALPADVWSALEAYAATGGQLTLLHPPRDVDLRLPLLTRPTPGDVQPYGFGQVRLCEGAEGCASGLLADAAALESSNAPRPGPVHPASPPSRWGHQQALGSGLWPLLPGVQAPVGRFLGLITLFVLAVGPGGLLLARRKGPVALLIAVPSVALVTCLAFVGWSVVVEGFSLHAARYSVTWLDRERDRTVTVGVGGYYANLEPEPFQVPVLGALLSSDSDWESRPLEADWTRGMVVTGGFLSARTYQEWGEVAVGPSRARLGVSAEGGQLRIRNALGAPLVEGYVRSGGGWWKLPALAEGAEGLATRLPASTRDDVTEELRPTKDVDQRLSPVLGRLFQEPLPEGGFLARLEGPGWTFSAAIPVSLHEGSHLVRGRVDGP